MSEGRETSSEIVAIDLVKSDACTRVEAAGRGGGEYMNHIQIQCHLVLKKMTQGFPGYLVVRTPHFHHQGSGFNPWSGN